MIGDKIKVNGEMITHAGIIATVVKETATRAEAVITDVFFPTHHKPHGDFQVGEDRQRFLREWLVGQTRTFWKTGTRANFEVSGNRVVVDWDHS